MIEVKDHPCNFLKHATTIKSKHDLVLVTPETYYFRI